MNRITRLRQSYMSLLDKYCIQNKVDVQSIKRLLDLEKTKKLMKRNVVIQQNIDKEIENAIGNDNR